MLSITRRMEIERQIVGLLYVRAVIQMSFSIPLHEQPSASDQFVRHRFTQCFTWLHDPAQYSLILITAAQNYKSVKACHLLVQLITEQSLAKALADQRLNMRTSAADFHQIRLRSSAARTWNSLSRSLTSLSSLASFRRQLKTELFTRSFPDLDSSAHDRI